MNDKCVCRTAQATPDLLIIQSSIFGALTGSKGHLHQVLSRGMLRTLSIIHGVKLLQPFSQQKREEQVSPFNHSFIIVIQIPGCKEIPVDRLYEEKMAEVVVLLNVLSIVSIPLTMMQLSLHVRGPS